MRRAWAAVAVAALASCGGKREAAPKPAVPAVIDAAVAAVVDAPAPGADVDAGAPVTAADAAVASASPIPADTRELIVAIPPSWDARTATLSLWRREPGGAWQRDGAPWPAITGVSGVAWGRGRHGDGAPAGQGGGVKREGDGKTPAGVFELGGAYGVAVAPPAGARLAYQPTSPRWRCIDDAASSHYNQLLDDTGVKVDWKSAEDLVRADPQYTWLVDVRHNPGAFPNGGSCIFLHVWRRPTAVTVGCTAMAEADLVTLIAAIDPAAHPLYVLLPADAYAALAGPWGLPPAS